MNDNAVRLPPAYAPPDIAEAAQRLAAERGVSFSAFAGQALAQAVGGARVGYEPLPYAFDGTAGPSFVRDAFEAARGRDDARDRLTRLRVMTQARAGAIEFAVTTANAAAVVPPGYRSDPFMSVTIADRPFVDAATPGVLTDSSPFTLPGRVTPTGATATASEGVNPTEGSMLVGVETVTPSGVSGTYRVTREIADSSNPAIDAVALAAMRESYAEQTEVMVYAELNGTNGQAGTITAGFVPSGAQVRTATGTGIDLRDKLKTAVAEYPFRRKRKCRNGILSQEAVTLLSGKDAGGLPLLDESTGASNALWSVQGCLLNPGWAISANAAGDADVFLLGADDLYAWERPLLEFRWEERSGPHFIDLALWGSFACRLLRPVGLSAIRYN